jgi:hypothetical protein
MNNTKENESLFEEIEVEELFRFDSNYKKFEELENNNFNLD